MFPVNNLHAQVPCNGFRTMRLQFSTSSPIRELISLVLFRLTSLVFRYVCIAVDSLTRWAEIRPCKTATAADAANFIYHDIVCRFGLPKSIQSDNGSHFANEVIERLPQILEIPHRFSTPYYPQSNGRAERLIGTLKSMMVRSIQDTDRDEETGVVNWQPAIYSALYVYRSSPHHSTGVSPAYLLDGENIALPFLHSHQPPPAPKDQVSHKKQIYDRLPYLREAIPGLRGAHHQFARIREGRKVLVRPTKYNVGEKVLLHNPDGKALGFGSAFATNWIGPYWIQAIFDKGGYKISTIPKYGKRPGVLKNPVNWSRLRRFVPQGDDEFFDPEVNAPDDLEYQSLEGLFGLFVSLDELFVLLYGLLVSLDELFAWMLNFLEIRSFLFRFAITG